jgi:hypothetical protein
VSQASPSSIDDYTALHYFKVFGAQMIVLRG